MLMVKRPREECLKPQRGAMFRMTASQGLTGRGIAPRWGWPARQEVANYKHCAPPGLGR